MRSPNARDPRTQTLRTDPAPPRSGDIWHGRRETRSAVQQYVHITGPGHRIADGRVIEMQDLDRVFHEHPDPNGRRRPEQHSAIRTTGIADRQDTATDSQSTVEHQRSQPVPIGAIEYPHAHQPAEDTALVHIHGAHPQRSLRRRHCDISVRLCPDMETESPPGGRILDGEHTPAWGGEYIAEHPVRPARRHEADSIQRSGPGRADRSEYRFAQCTSLSERPFASNDSIYPVDASVRYM